MYNITIFRDYIFKKPYFTTVFYFFILFTFFIIPINAEILVDVLPNGNIYSDVDSNYDYSTRYEVQAIKEIEDTTDFSITWCYGLGVTFGYGKYYETLKPTEIYINSNLNSNLKEIIAYSDYNVGSDFVEGTGFNLQYENVTIGYGSFFMWGDMDGKLIYLYEFDYLDTLTDIKTYSIIYNDDTIFNELPLYYLGQLVPYGTSNKYGCTEVSGCAVYLKSNHKTDYYNGAWILTASRDYQMYMATTNTITNNFISENDIYYYYNISSYIGYVHIDNILSSYKLGLTHNLTSSNTEISNDYYIFDSEYTSIDQTHNNQRNLGIKCDLYIDSTKNYPDYFFILDKGGNLEDSGYYATIPEPDEPLDYSTNNELEFDKTPYNETDNAYIAWNISEYINTYTDETFKLNILTSGDIHGNNYLTSYSIKDAYNNPKEVGYISYHIYSLMNDSVTGTIKAFITYKCEETLYEYITLFSSIITTDILSINDTYEFPNPIEPPEEPETPINDTPPDTPPPPPPPTGLNQTLNTSWSNGYYNTVNDMVNGLGSPLYNFTGWSLTPITILSSSITDFNTIMNDTFNSASTDLVVISESVNIITSGLHPKVKNVITYYLVWLVLLIIMRKR